MGIERHLKTTSIDRVVQRAIDCVLCGDHQTARDHLSTIDFRGLLLESEAKRRAIQGTRTSLADPRRSPRGTPSESQKLQIYHRDHFTCWFCERRTIYSPTLMILSAAFPDILPYRSNNWTPKQDHAIYWTWSTSWDHFRPVARGGSSRPTDNLVTACYQCNDIRGDWLPDEIGWKPTPPKLSNWDGLSGKMPALRNALGLGPRSTIAKGVPISGPPPVGALIRATIPHRDTQRRAPFRVDSIEENYVFLTEMWRGGANQTWRASSKQKHVALDVLASVELISENAPEIGETD